MAVSGAIPEFFTNMISTFITESEMGLGAVIGTLFFNTLGVAACAGIATRKPVQLLWYPLLRDCIIFAIAVSMLTAMSWDGVIEWHEGLILTLGYIVYWIVLFQNTRIKRCVDYLKLDRWWCCLNNSYGEFWFLTVTVSLLHIYHPLMNWFSSHSPHRTGPSERTPETGTDEERRVAGGAKVQFGRRWCTPTSHWSPAEDEYSAGVRHLRRGHTIRY